MSSFYSKTPEAGLRLGDIVWGFSVVTPQAHVFVDSEDATRNLVIQVHQPRFLVVMTPCCSIEEGALLLAPLTKVRRAFFRNPYFEEELTRINCKVAPKNSLPPNAWDKMKSDVRAAKLSEDPGYVFMDCFIYEPNDLLPPYTLKQGEWTKETGNYLVDFKTVYRFECNLIQRDAPVPLGCNKILQLTASARKGLRDKLTFYFSRPSQEDMAELGTPL